MTELRRRMIDAMTVRGFSPRTHESYSRAVRGLAKHYHRSPDELSVQEVQALPRAPDRNAQVVVEHVQHRGLCVQVPVPHHLRTGPRGVRAAGAQAAAASPRDPEPRGVARLIDAPPNPKHRLLLATTHAGGLRVSEVVHLRVADVDHGRMTLRVEQGGRKDRVRPRGRGLNKAAVIAGAIPAFHAANGWRTRGLQGTITAQHAANMTYIHHRPRWPEFKWDSEALAGPLAAVRHKQGKHLGKMEALGFELQTEASLTALTNEVVKSSAIEGQDLDPEEVRSSIARRMGLDVAGLVKPGREVEGIVEMMLDATRNFDEPLTAERLFGWHAALFPTARSGMHRIIVGAWRTDDAGPMQVVSGPIGKARVHFQAPEAERLDREMERFLAWFAGRSDIDPVLRAAIAHFWFVTIHPFEDGNGRIARAITDMALAHADRTKDRFYSMSSAIEAERREYYSQLESAQRGSLDITAWIGWFLGCLDRAIQEADNTLGSVLHKAKLWQRINPHPVNERQRRVINRMLDDFTGHLTTSKYAEIAKCSTDTALRDIRALLKRGIIAKNPRGGRSTSYRLAEPDVVPSPT